MRRLLLLGVFAIGTAMMTRAAFAKSVHNYQVTRHAADHYVTSSGRDLYTLDCTVTARLMDAVVVDDAPYSVVMFLDADGEVEAECKLRTRKTRAPGAR